MKNKLLVVIDFQNDFVDGTLGFPQAKELDPLIAQKIRKFDGFVIYTQDTHPQNYLQTREGKNLPVEHCLENTPGWEIYGETKKALVEVGALGFKKKVFGLDLTPEIMIQLPTDLTEIELVGLVSNICVLSNAVTFQTKYPEATIVVDASLTKSFDPEMNAKALDVLGGIQVKVINRGKEE